MARITVAVSDLLYVLKSTAGFRSTDALLPVLCATNLRIVAGADAMTDVETSGGAILVAEATDRFTLARAEVSPHPAANLPVDVISDATAMLGTAEEKVLSAWLKTFKAADPVTVEISTDEGADPGDSGRLTFTVNAGTHSADEIKPRPLDGHFPNMSRLLAGMIQEKETACTTVTITPEFLKRVGAPATKYERKDTATLIFPEKSSKPLGFKVGSHLVGGLMPRRTLG